MITLQSAVDVANQSGISVWLDRGVIILILTNLGLIGRDWIKTRKRNGSLTPGKSADCLEHRDKLNRLEEWKKGADGDIAEIKMDVKTLLQRIPPK